MTLTPKIRFSEFEEEWSQPTIDEIFELRNGYTPSKAIDAFWKNGSIPWFRMEDIREKGGFLKDAFQNITELAVKGSGLFEKNSIILATTATIGVHAMLIADSLANQRFTNLKIRKSLSDKYIPNFVYYSFFKIDDWCLKNTNSGGLLSVDIRELCKQIFPTPTLSEQRRLSHFFTLIDERIRLEGERLASLKQVKAASLQSFFPQEGEKEPRVRFKGFSGEWKKVKLGNVLTIKRGLTYSPTDIVNKGIRVLRSSNIDEDKFVISDSDVFVKRDCVNISFARKGDILITAANGSPRLVGKHAIVQDIEETPTVAGGFMLLATGEETEYVNACMGAEWYRKFLIYGVSGGNGAIGNLNKLELEEALMPYPTNKEESKKISTYFTNLDEQIRLEGEKIEMLKRVKGACLEGMMV